ncbi:uncharacterized protein RAG0_09056 [Rhynchosporium agropyri]|uniref:Uncharacterized protein n=1 Tax=Rhynchosporium agropyri TaxID=914238 RepID=A0A1E1KWJ4_9HELO|nr:uncharacterized protein RAG0_09056 [Rhynchosporium agropyri]
MVIGHSLLTEHGGSACRFGAFLQDTLRGGTSQTNDPSPSSACTMIFSRLKRSSADQSQAVLKAILISKSSHVSNDQNGEAHREIPEINLIPSSPPTSPLRKSNTVAGSPGYLAPPVLPPRKKNRRQRRQATEDSTQESVLLHRDRKSCQKCSQNGSKTLDSSSTTVRLMDRAIREENIRDLVTMATQHIAAFPFCQEYYVKHNSDILQSEHHSLTRELRDVLRFGNPKEYMTPLELCPQETQSRDKYNGVRQWNQDISVILQSLQDDGSYATFPISHNLILFARVCQGPRHRLSLSNVEFNQSEDTLQTINSVHELKLEIAEFILTSTENSENHADMFNFPVIGRKMLDCYLQVMAKTRTAIKFTGWYKAKESSRKLNRERLMGCLDEEIGLSLSSDVTTISTLERENRTGHAEIVSVQKVIISVLNESFTQSTAELSATPGP